jgi:hypothetical protein
MTEGTIVKLDEQELLTFVRRCFEWRNADVFAFGRHDSISRLGEIAGYISMMSNKDGGTLADSVSIVLPPLGARNREVMLHDVKEGIRRAYRRFEPDDAKTARFVDEAFMSVGVVQAEHFTSTSLDALLATAKDRQVVIVGEASYYRSETVVASTGGTRLPEDDWCRHLYAVMLAAEERARASGSYIILDLGQYLPAREENLALLQTAGNVGLCGGSYTDELTPDEVVAMVTEAYDTATAGDVGKAVSLIEKDNRLSERRKWLLQLMVFERAGMRDEVSRILDNSASTIASLKSEDMIGVARIAAGADRDDFVQELVERALPTLVAANDLENALQISLVTRRQPLIERVREHLRSLHPTSHLLRSVDARVAARAGDYAKAADLLASSPDARECTVGNVFRLLANAVAGSSFVAPVKLAQDLAAKMPDWTADIQREIMLSLERASRRGEAIELLFSGDVVWDKEWFVFAHGLLSRSLASGSDVVGPDTISRLIGVTAAFMAEYPAVGYARTSVADLLDAEHVGIAGTVIMVMNAVERAERLPDVEKSQGTDHKLPDLLGRLSDIMARVLNWLAWRGDGIIVSGRDAVPAEVLGEDPDSVLHGLLQLVDHHAPEPSDPVEDRVLRHFVAVASAVAPLATDPDVELSVLRGTAAKAILSGRVQLARDLAEQILCVAGERPGRRRRALAAFADIYARVGRLREALLALIAAFELPSERTWREAWDEQSVLLRILRDVGMSEESIRIACHLRKSLGKIPNGEVYASRLDTLELHAQFRRCLAGRHDAWTTSQLLKAAIANADAVLALGDEPLPSAVMLRQLIDRAESEMIDVPANGYELLDRLTACLSGPYRTLVAAAGRLTDAALVASFAGPIQAARYNEDVSYDLRLARMMASRLARGSTDRNDLEGFTYAVEVLGAQGVGVHGAGAEVRAAEGILADPKMPLETATEIARLGLAVVGIALDDSGLMTMTVTAAGPQNPVAVHSGTFDVKELFNWSRTYPYGYSNPKLTQEDFRAATSGLGLRELPDKAVILSGGLSLVPPNVLTVDGDLAGLTKSLATVPSLSWLKASIAAARRGDGSAAAWIPIAAGGSYMDTLSLMAGDIVDLLNDAKIQLHTQSAAPPALASADLAIVGAHGGLAEGNRFFRGLSDDQAEPTDLRQLIDVLRGSRVALLFVCSGGRLDQHPESGGLVGIAHRLLDKGLDAVIAPSWPIPFTMVRPWLSAFLKEWNSGSQVIDAYRSGNDAVATATSTDLSRSIAMSLYGNPFVKR